ncbi:MAG: SDR family oxidoreductase [Euryarchaeota archaeon]|nr:SDR family oxidoreductase [Euryarchaeota archaeon]MCG2738472.1 SDR family oxidoreductase [Candidatus Methanoperedenaceae archaeon]
MNNKKVLITGGAGFIGSNIAEELAKDNEVVILDDLSSGRMENIRGLLENNKVRLIKGSITDLDLLQQSFRGVDYVFHLAAIPGVPASVNDPVASNIVNINGTLNVLIAAQDNGIRKVVNASSCAVYGDAAVPPVAETSQLAPKSPYAVTKLTGEYYCNVFREIYNQPTVSLRYFNVYGPRQDPGSEYAAVIPKFIAKVFADDKLVIYGDGLQTRDFIFVKDVVRANIMAAESGESGIFNIGSGEAVTINELAEVIINLCGKNLEIVHVEPREGDIMHSRASIERAGRIGYKPEYGLEEGLKETIGWFGSQEML